MIHVFSALSFSHGKDMSMKPKFYFGSSRNTVPTHASATWNTEDNHQAHVEQGS